MARVPIVIDGVQYPLTPGTTFLDNTWSITGSRKGPEDLLVLMDGREVPWSTRVPAGGMGPLRLVHPDTLDKMALVGSGTYACVVPRQPCETLLKGELPGPVAKGAHVSRFGKMIKDRFGNYREAREQFMSSFDTDARFRDLNPLIPQALCRASAATLQKVRTVCPKAEPVFSVAKQGGQCLWSLIHGPLITDANIVQFFRGALPLIDEIVRLALRGWVHGDISASNILVDGT